jgi:hypothetical protein
MAGVAILVLAFVALVAVVVAVRLEHGAGREADSRGVEDGEIDVSWTVRIPSPRCEEQAIRSDRQESV